MVIVMNVNSTKNEVDDVVGRLKKVGLDIHLSHGKEKILIGVVGDTKLMADMGLEQMSGVEKAVKIQETYKLANRNFKLQDSIIDLNGAKIGGKEIMMIAGPCSVENREQILQTAIAVKKAGAKMLRGGVFKPRTSPYAFQGLEEEGLKLLREAKEATGLKIITEVTNEKNVEVAYGYVDMFQIGARNVQNFHLLKEIGKTDKPVLLKRGSATTIDEWLNAAEYIMSEGNHNVVLCERGIRTFETATRNTLDISAVAVIKRLSHLPIIIDPSHAGGKSCYISSLSKAGIAAGADGLIVEVHPNPKEALSDAAQQITPGAFEELCKDVSKIAIAVDRSL